MPLRDQEDIRLVICRDPAKYEKYAGTVQIVGSELVDVHARALHGKHPHLRSFHDLRGDGPCLILGMGPTRSFLEGRKRPSMPIFAINRAVGVVPDADYWCVSDQLPIVEMHRSYTGKNAVMIGSLWQGLKDEVRPDLPVVIADIANDPRRWKGEQPLYWCLSTFGWTLHLAMRMGHNPIYLLGCEHSLGGYKHPEWSDEFLANEHAGVRRRVLEMFTEEEKPKWHDPSVEVVDLSGGVLPFPKASPETVL